MWWEWHIVAFTYGTFTYSTSTFGTFTRVCRVFLCVFCSVLLSLCLERHSDIWGEGGGVLLLAWHKIKYSANQQTSAIAHKKFHLSLVHSSVLCPPLFYQAKLAISLAAIWQCITPHFTLPKATQTDTRTQLHVKSQDHTAAALGNDVYWRVTSCRWVRSTQCLIAGFRRDVDDIRALQGS